MSGTRSTIADLWASGMSIPAIALEMGLAVPTVGYHVRRLQDERPSAGKSPGTPGTPAPPSARLSSPTRREVARLLASEMPRVAVARTLGISKSTVSYHARRLGMDIDERCARRYDWSAVQAFYDRGHSVRECVAAFGFSSASWAEAVKRGAIVPRPSALPLDDLLAAGTYRGRYSLKLRLIKEGMKAQRCERCGIEEWRGSPLTLALHHVNGDRHDNRLENLQLLCPNCHSQTENFAGRNGRRRTLGRA